MPDNQSDDKAPAGDAGAPSSAFVGRPVRVPRAYEALARIIRDRIVSGELAEGDRIPSEAALAREARVSRSTVREALRTLEEGGMIARATPKVMIVKSVGEERATSEVQVALHRKNVTFEHLHEALMILEPEITRLAAQRAGATELQLLQENLHTQAEALEDVERWSELDQAFHLEIAEMSDNPALALARAPIADLLHPPLRTFLVAGDLIPRALASHRRILEEMQLHDGDGAALMARRHVNELRAIWVESGLAQMRVETTTQEHIAALAGRFAASG
jgi:DNA-binding FadR family transcriptional regulator